MLNNPLPLKKLKNNLEVLKENKKSEPETMEELLTPRSKINLPDKECWLVFHPDQDNAEELMDIFWKEKNLNFTLKKWTKREDENDKLKKFKTN